VRVQRDPQEIDRRTCPVPQRTEDAQRSINPCLLGAITWCETAGKPPHTRRAMSDLLSNQLHQGSGMPAESGSSQCSPSSAARPADSASPAQHGPGRSDPSDSGFVRVSGTSTGSSSVIGRPGEIWATRRLGCRVHADHQVCRGPGRPPVEIMVTPATMVTDGPRGVFMAGL
jgi:hypothetical protein